MDVVSMERKSPELAGIPGRVVSGEDFQVAVRDFLDEFKLLPDGDAMAAAIEREPERLDDPRFNAYLGALAEHLTIHSGLPRPQWCLAKDRFLERFWFVSPTPGFRAVSLAQAPAAFRRRGVMVPRRSLERV